MKRKNFLWRGDLWPLGWRWGPGLRRCKRLNQRQFYGRQPPPTRRQNRTAAAGGALAGTGQRGERCAGKLVFLPYLVERRGGGPAHGRGPLRPVGGGGVPGGVAVGGLGLPQPPAAGGHFGKRHPGAHGPGAHREQARAKALETIAQPGHSEHETGLALDFNDVSQGFQETVAYSGCGSTGRRTGLSAVPKGKGGRHRGKSGALALPLCGREHALAMERLGLCLEEYVRWQKGLGRP